MVASLDSGDELELNRIEVEEVLALAEVLVVAHATLYYTSDAAILASTKCPVTTIAPHMGSRCLSSETIGALLLDTELGTLIWDIMSDMYAGDDDLGMQYTMEMILAFQELGQLDVSMHNQVMVDRAARRLACGNLATLVVALHSG